MKKIIFSISLGLLALGSSAQTGGYLNITDNYQIRYTPSTNTSTPSITSFWRIPDSQNPPTIKYFPLCNVFFQPPPQTPGIPPTAPVFTPQAASLFADLIQISDQSTNNTAALSFGIMNGSGIIALEQLQSFPNVGNEALKLNPGCPMDVNICEGGGYTKIFNGAGVVGDLDVSNFLKLGGGTFGLQTALEANLPNGTVNALSFTDPYATATNKRLFEVTAAGKTSLGLNLQSNNAMFTVGQASKAALALCLTDNTTTSNKNFFNVYGSGQTFIGADLQQTTGAMFTVGQSSKTSLAFSLTDNTSTTNKPFYNVYGSGQTFIGSDLQQSTGAMLTVGQSNKTALALSLTDNTTATNKPFFNVYGNGYTEINVSTKSAMSIPSYPGSGTSIQNERVFTVRDVAAAKDLFVVRADGKVFAREVEINLVQYFPDYVFDSSYDLKPIGEVADFISRHKHLPGFEKAAHYEKNGMSVGDMLVKQQEKIEEQMLYIIQLEKRLQALENKK